MTTLVGVDVGYGFVKASDAASGFSFPSIVSEGHTKPVFRAVKREWPVVDDLRIEIDQDLYFVGKAALRHSPLAYRDLSYSRTIGEGFGVLLFSALSLFCRKKHNVFRLVTGLPVERMHMADRLYLQLKGEHTIGIHHEGSTREVEITMADIQIVPQPLGAYWSQTLDASEGAAGHQEELTGVVDVGFRTTDLAAVDSGEYVPEKSKTLPIGLSTAYQEIGSRLATEYGLEIESYALDSAMIRQSVTISGQTVDISHIVAPACERLAASIMIQLNSHWRSADFSKILLTGGGGQAVSQYLDLPHVQLVEDPITANCLGYLAWGRQIWQNPVTTEQEVESAIQE